MRRTSVLQGSIIRLGERGGVILDRQVDNSEAIRENLEYLVKNHGEIYEAYSRYGELVHEKGGPLDEKTRWLIKVALSTEGQYEYALRTHILKALKAGCTREEI